MPGGAVKSLATGVMNSATLRSALAEGAIPLILEIAGPLDLEVVLVRVVQPLPPEVVEGSRYVTVEDVPARMAEAEGYLRGVAARLEARGIRTRSEARRGDPVTEIVAAAKAAGADLIAMTTHGRSGLGRLLFGSVAEAVLRHCSTCRLVEKRCLESLDTRQRKILSGQALDIPVMRSPGGAVAFLSPTPGLAQEVCRQAERQTSPSLLSQCAKAGPEGIELALGAMAAIARLSLTGHVRTTVDASSRFIDVGETEEGESLGVPPSAKLTTHQLLLRHATPFTLSLASLTVLLLVQGAGRWGPQLSARGAPESAFVQVLLLSLPHTLALTIPMAYLEAVAA